MYFLKLNFYDVKARQHEIRQKKARIVKSAMEAWIEKNSLPRTGPNAPGKL
jgi:hypothetical protein